MLAIRRRACSVSSERHIRELGVRYLRALNRGQGSARPVLLAFASSKVLMPQCLARVIFLPASGTSPSAILRYPIYTNGLPCSYGAENIRLYRLGSVVR